MMQLFSSPSLRFSALACLLTILGGCQTNIQTEAPKSSQDKRFSNMGKLFKKELVLAGKGEEAVSVNPYLFQASLDVLSFMVIQNASGQQGLIETAWYTPKNTPNERLKVIAHITPTKLAVESLHITVLAQKKSTSQAKGASQKVSQKNPETYWQAHRSSSRLQSTLHEKIMLRARTLKSRTYKA